MVTGECIAMLRNMAIGKERHQARVLPRAESDNGMTPLHLHSTPSSSPAEIAKSAKEISDDMVYPFIF